MIKAGRIVYRVVFHSGKKSRLAYIWKNLEPVEPTLLGRRLMMIMDVGFCKCDTF